MARQRRTTYYATVRYADGSEGRVNFRVYNGKREAHELAANRGWEILEIKSAAERKAAGGFKIDPAALREAIDFLGIEGRVEVRFHGRVGNTNGNYRRSPGYHNIMLKSYLTPEQASRSLWHELAHAMQAERVGVEWEAHVVAQKRWSYSRRPIEVEARQYEQYAEVVKVCV